MLSPSTAAQCMPQRNAVPFRECTHVRDGNYAVNAVFSHTSTFGQGGSCCMGFPRAVRTISLDLAQFSLRLLSVARFSNVGDFIRSGSGVSSWNNEYHP